MKLMQSHLDKALREHGQIVKLYRKKYSKKITRDWRTYEQTLALRIKTAAQELLPVIEKAYSMIEVKGRRKGKVSATKKILILLLKDIFQLSNRKMANFLAFFTALTGIDISYKTVERIYSDELARMVVHNMFVVMVKDIKNANASGDGTGYSLTVTKHYRNEREKELKNKRNEISNKKIRKRKGFVYAFSLMDLDTKMYIGYGTSIKSEKEAFHKAKNMAEGISIDTVRLDKLYSYQSIVKEFGEDTTVYIIPKKNATIKGSPEWKRIIRSFVDDQISHLEEYYKRNNSESGYSADKRLCGWKIWQKKPERIDLALMCKGVWHNLMLLH